jgi:hypothetical protein
MLFWEPSVFLTSHIGASRALTCVRHAVPKSPPAMHRENSETAEATYRHFRKGPVAESVIGDGSGPSYPRERCLLCNGG